MGRKLFNGGNPSTHPIVPLWLFIAFMAAIVTLISSLCVSRKKSPPPPASPKEITKYPEVATSLPNEAIVTTTTTNTTMEPQSATHNAKDVATQSQTGEELPQLPLPPPPGMTHLRAASTCHFRTTSLASESKLMTSMSVRVQGGGGLGLKQYSRREEPQKHDKKLKHEDSIWKKTIILGEKCRVPDEDDTVLYDEKGNRISTYHPKNPGSLPVSRQSSYIDPNAIPSSTSQK